MCHKLSGISHRNLLSHNSSPGWHSKVKVLAESWCPQASFGWAVSASSSCWLTTDFQTVMNGTEVPLLAANKSRRNERVSVSSQLTKESHRKICQPPNWWRDRGEGKVREERRGEGESRPQALGLQYVCNGDCYLEQLHREVLGSRQGFCGSKDCGLRAVCLRQTEYISFQLCAKLCIEPYKNYQSYIHQRIFIGIDQVRGNANYLKTNNRTRQKIGKACISWLQNLN